MICRGTLRLDFLTLLSKKLTEPLRVLPKVRAYLITWACRIVQYTYAISTASCNLYITAMPSTIDSQEEAVKEVVEFMDAYSFSMEDYETLMELSKFQVF